MIHLLWKSQVRCCDTCIRHRHMNSKGHFKLSTQCDTLTMLLPMAVGVFSVCQLQVVSELLHCFRNKSLPLEFAIAQKEWAMQTLVRGLVSLFRNSAAVPSIVARVLYPAVAVNHPGLPTGHVPYSSVTHAHTSPFRAIGRCHVCHVHQLASYGVLAKAGVSHAAPTWWSTSYFNQVSWLRSCFCYRCCGFCNHCCICD